MWSLWQTADVCVCHICRFSFTPNRWRSKFTFVAEHIFITFLFAGDFGSVKCVLLMKYHHPPKCAGYVKYRYISSKNLNLLPLGDVMVWHRCPKILSKHGANSIGPNSMSSLPSPLRRWAWSLPIKISLLVDTVQNLPNTSKKLTLLHGILLKCIYKEICTIMYSCMICLCKFAPFWLVLRLYIRT